jgi:CheY-like chemotaxis protein
MSAHIMVVDDDLDVREALVDVLEDEGYVVSAAGDGRQALGLLLTGRPKVDLILLDLMMPNMNGFEFREAQLKDPACAAIPVVIITADARANERAAEMGVAGLVTKPVKIQPLLDVVNGVVVATGR